MASVTLVLTAIAVPAFAAPQSVHEITANWAGDPVPTEAPYGQPVTAEFHVNTNDTEDPYSNEPVENVRATLTVGNGAFTSIPQVCKTRDVTPVSEISADGVTLLCNLGTIKEGTATVIQAPVRATSTEGGDLTIVGTATSDSAIAEAGPADPGPLPITYVHGMDLSLVMAPGDQAQGFVQTSRVGGSRPFIQMNYSLILEAGSRPGPASYSFPVSISANIAGATNGLVWEGCVPVGIQSRSTGQPFSDPAQEDRTNFPGCVVSGSGTNYTVSLSNLDYTLVNTPVNDSFGQPLPGNGAYIASGTVRFSIPAPVTAITTYTFTAAPGSFMFDDDVSEPDANAANNVSSATLRPPGGFSNAWYGTPTQSRTAWDDNLWVSPGTSQGVPLPQPGIETEDDWTEAVAAGTHQTTLPLYHQANSQMWDGYQGPGGAQMAGLCTMSQNPAFVATSFEGGGWNGGGLSGYENYETARFFYTTQVLNTKTETCGEASPSAKWIEITPPAGDSLTDPRIASDILMDLPAGVTGVKMTWNPAVDRSVVSFLRAFGHIDPAAPTSGEGWTVGTFNSPQDPAVTWPGYPAMNGYVNISTAGGGTVIPGSTYGPNTNGARDVYRLQGAQGLIEKVASDTTAQPGIPVTYTLRAQAQNLVTSPPPATFEVVDTLPEGMVYVAGSGEPAPTSVSPDGRTLTWTYTDVAPNVFQTIRYQAQRPADSVIAPGTRLTNTAVINTVGDNRPANTAGRSASATVTVPSASATIFGKSAEANVLSFEGDSSAWVLTINSQDPVASAFTDTIDILPAVGDGRGTDIDGTYTVTGVDAPAGSTVYYTSAPLASLSTDPRDASNGGTPGSVSGNTVGWSTTPIENPSAIRVIAGELAPGASQTIRIEFTTPAGSSCETPAEDDNKPGQILVNSAGSFAGHTALPMLSSAVTEIANCYAVDLKKYVQDADGVWHDANTIADYPTFRAGDEVNYRIVVENIGQGTVTDLEITDDLFPEGSFTVDSLARGETETHEFAVTLTGGGNIVNTACGTAATPPDAEAPTILCDPAGVLVTNYTTVKSSDPAEGETVRPGETVTYTVTVTQEGDAPADAVFSDTLENVSDDATYNEDVTASLGTVEVSDGIISWTGTVPVGEVATITYSVTVTGAGDMALENVVTSPGCVDAASCTTNHLIGDYTVSKMSDPATGTDVAIDDVITYTVTVSQRGTGAVAGATITDDLSDVLDDATWNDELAATSGSASYDADATELEWSGDLAVGQVVTITYSVTVTGAGDMTLNNQVDPGELGECVPAPDETPDCRTSHETGRFEYSKTADPEHNTDVQVGDVITYTVTVDQLGPAVVAASLKDDLSDVLDDASWNGDAVASAGAVALDGSTLNWTADLAPGDVVTITYSVTVTGAGNTTIANAVGTESPSGDCVPAADENAYCRTVHKTGGYVFGKTANPASGRTVAIGDVVTYTVTITHRGEGVVTDAIVTDDLSGVLDDARWNGNAAATSGVVNRDGNTLTWTGDLAVGQVVTVTYAVTVTAAGNDQLKNVVTSPDERALCDPTGICITEHRVPVSPPLAHTGYDLSWMTITAALVLLIGGAGVLLIGRRQRAAEAQHDRSS